MAVPGHLSLHGSKTADEEKFPFVEVDVVLVGGFAAGAFPTWAKLVGVVICAQEIMDDGSAFP